MMKPTPLRRCPWCGRRPVVSCKSFRSTGLGEHDQFAVRCGDSTCQVRPQTHWCLTEQEARDIWNKMKPRKT